MGKEWLTGPKSTKNNQERQKMRKIVKKIIGNKTGSTKNQPKSIKYLIFELESENLYLIDDS